VIGIYRDNFFPGMKVLWKAYPNHIGHFTFRGCNRCHDGLHKNAKGEAISHQCSSCHDIISQGPEGKTESSVNGLEFRHPGGSDEWKEMACTDCHNGGDV